METNAARLFVYSVAQAFDGATENNTITLEPGVLARGNFLHWAWQIKFVAAQNVAHARRQDAARLRRLGLQARHGARALPPRREGRLGDGPDERGAAPVRRQGRAARVRVARLLEPELQPPRRRERGQEARLDRASASSPSSSSPRPPRRRPRSRRRPEAMAVAAPTAPARPGSRAARPGTRDATACGRAGRRRSPCGRTTGSRSATSHGGQRAEVVGLAGPRRARSSSFGPTSPPGAEETFRADRDAVVRVARAGRRAGGRGRRARLRPPARDRAGDADARRRRGRAPRAARRPAARLPGRPRLRARLRGEGGRVHPGDRRARAASAPTSSPSARRSCRTGKERGLDATATRSLMGNAYPAARAPLEVLRPRPRAARRGRPRHGRPPRHVRARLHGEVLRGHGLLRPRQLLGQLQRASSSRTRSSRARAGRRSTSSSTPPSTRTTSTSSTSRGRARATTCCCAPRPTSSASRAPAPTTSTRPTPGTRRRCTCASIPAKERFSAAIAHRVTPDAEPKLTKETGFHDAHLGADEPLHRVQRLLAADLLRQPRRGRRVLGLPREGGGHGPLAAAEVRDPRPGRRGAAAGDDDARHPAARRRPGRLHGDVQRDGRHARRRHRVPDRARQLPLRRRRRVRRRLAARAGRAARAARLGEGVDRRPPQRRACRGRPRARSWRRSSGRRRRRRRSPS